MFSSVGQIVGLIEIEPAASGAPLLASPEIEGGVGPDAEDASLDDLLARLVGRPATHSRQTSRTNPPAALRPTNRLALPSIRQAPGMVLGADLARLEADLADETHRLRLQLATAGGRAQGR